MKACPIAACLLAVLPCASFAAEPIKLVYALPIAVPAAIPYIALDHNFFREEGLDVEAMLFSSGREALQALLAGQAQIQSVSETPVVHAIIQGNEIWTIATAAEHQEAKLIARKDRGISKAEDLIGKRVATLPGTNSDYFMYRFLEAHRIPLSGIQIANMPPPEMVVAYVKGDIDAYFAWEPHIYYGRKHLPETSIVFDPGELYRGWLTVNMTPDFVRGHPETVRRVIRALLKAEDFARTRPRDAMDLVAKRLGMEPAVLAELWKGYVFKVELQRALPGRMTEIGRWSIQQSKSARQLPDFRKFIYGKALAEERPGTVGF